MTDTFVTKDFSLTLLKWFDEHGRKDLPWQHPRSAYRVFVSEIMLQQTQVKTVIPYFLRFLARFPDIKALALATEDEVLAHWSGLGYYSRGRNLHKAAKIIEHDFQGHLPSTLDDLIKLPGIGPSTAGAILSLAYNQPTAILDGNVKRVLSRYFLVDGSLSDASVQKNLWDLANQCMPAIRCTDYTQAIMDFGATCCTLRNPRCKACPLQTTCLAHLNAQVSNYPQKVLKKILPTKKQQFLLLHTNHPLIYLEKRPSSGLWGGLWCLPSIDMQLCPTSYVSENHGFKTENTKELLTMKHSFSHFHLHIKALSLQINLSALSLASTKGRWFYAHELPMLGLAKPVSIIIDNFLAAIHP